MAKSILLVEDDPSLGFVIKDNLGIKGYNVTLCKDGEEGEQTFRKGDFDLCILDVMLPKKDGFSLARSVREINKHVPIIFLTAKAMTDDKLEGFRTGADDYVTKPFSLDELYFRIEVFLRRSQDQVNEASPSFQIGEYQFDPSRLTIRRNGQERSLTQKEAEVLRYLCQNRERVLKREEILNKIWGNDDYFMGRSLDVFISKLRKYLKDDPAIQIANYHGVGFRLEVITSSAEKL
ncbi:MAG TPA: response regulator transcription factor [Ohtaekwangia sp.]|nr:response regulator transcription factor [Ohtaekwangia sp.]